VDNSCGVLRARFSVVRVGLRIALFAIAVAAVLTTPSVCDPSATTHSGLSVTVVDGTIVTTSVPVTTPAELAAFEASNIPKVITIDTATAKVVTVTEQPSSPQSAAER
jgi:hypothetical protein